MYPNEIFIFLPCVICANLILHILTATKLSYNKDMRIILGILISISFSSVHAQDERFFRDIYNGNLAKEFAPKKEEAKVVVSTSFIAQDIDDDGLPEFFKASKRDNIDWFEIYDFRKQLIFEAQLETTGQDSGIYKINFVTLGKDLKGIILYFYEGFTQSTRFDGTARVYLASFEKNNLSSISFVKGPHFFHEFSKVHEQYWNRPMTVNVLDLNNDGVKEITTAYRHIQYILKYHGDGVWKQL